MIDCDENSIRFDEIFLTASVPKRGKLTFLAPNFGKWSNYYISFKRSLHEEYNAFFLFLQNNESWTF